MSTRLINGLPDGMETRYFCHECRAFIDPISPDTLICPTCNGSFIEEVNGENEGEFEAEDSQLNQHALDYQNDVFSLISAFLPGFGATDMGSNSTLDTPQETSPSTNGQATQMADEIDHVMPGPSSTGAQSGFVNSFSKKGSRTLFKY